MEEIKKMLRCLYGQALSIDTDKITTQELNKFIKKDTSIVAQEILQYTEKRVHKARGLGYIDGWMASSDGKPLMVGPKQQLKEIEDANA